MLFHLLLLYLFSLLYNISDCHLVNIQTKQYPRPIFSALAAPCPKTPPCLETFVNISLVIQFLINKESLICNFFHPSGTKIAELLLLHFQEEFGAIRRKLQYISLSMVHLPLSKAKDVWN